MEELFKILNHVFGDDVNESEEYVGKISPELIASLGENKRRRGFLEDLIEAKLKAAAMEVRNEMEPKAEALIKEHDALWARAYDELNVPEDVRKNHHRLRSKTGEVYRVIKTGKTDDEPPFEFKL